MTDATAAVHAGSEYTALCALSLSRDTHLKEGDRRADIVLPGETVRLTDDEAQALLRRHRVPVIARKGERNLRRVTAHQLMNPMRPAAAFGAIPDPPDKSEVTELGEGTAGSTPNDPDPGEVDADFGAEAGQGRPRGRRPAGK